jgi:hypothetical protein
MAPAIVDNHAILALHQNILAALRSGTGAWFADALRKPNEADVIHVGYKSNPGHGPNVWFPVTTPESGQTEIHP